MKTVCTLVAILSTASLAAPALHAQSFMDFDAAPASGSIFKAVKTPNGHATPFQNDLHSVSASSKTDIWAVGQTAIHFNGAKWTAFTVPDIKGDNTSLLGGVADLSPTNVWAVGLINKGEENPNQIIEHYNGTAWKISPGPTTFLPTDEPALESVTAISASDIWAAGFILTDDYSALFPLFEHYNGTAWTAYETIDSDAVMYGVSADASNDVWAVGTVAEYSTATEHYDGSTWSVVPSPNAGAGWNVLFGVTALSPTNVWAAGWYTAEENSTRPEKTLIEHWNGTAWEIVSSPNVGPNTQYQSNQLWGITAVSANDIWAFGAYFAASGSGEQSTLVEHWNGTSWRIVPSPDPVSGSYQVDILFGGTVIPTGDLWLVGNEFGSTLALNATGQ